MSYKGQQLVVKPVWDIPPTRSRYVLNVSSSPLDISCKDLEELDTKVDDDNFSPLHAPTRENEGVKDSNQVDLNRQARSMRQTESANDKAKRMPLDMRSHNMHGKARLQMDMRRYLGRKGFVSNEYSVSSVDDSPCKETSPYSSTMPKELPVSLSTNACLSTTLRLNESVYIKPPNTHVEPKTPSSRGDHFSAKSHPRDKLHS
ncbi:hypothetical protein FOXYSP1_11375 [Fusarium oxysporum f. sp. phaseoli]